MRTDLEIYQRLDGLGPENEKLRAGLERYIEVNQRLAAGAQVNLEYTVALCKTASSETKSGIGKDALALRFSMRDQGLLMLEVSRLLAELSRQCFAISQNIHKAIND